MARNARFGVALLALTAIAGGGQTVQAQSISAAHAQIARIRAKTDSLTTVRDQRIAATVEAAPAAAPTSETTLGATPATAGKPAAKDSLDPVAESATADSVQRAREIEVMRETFAYAGGTRDPFTSLITKDDSSIEIGNLDLVGVYLDLKMPSNNVIVLREKGTDGKRHKMRVGDQLGRSRLVQIRARDAVFTIADFGYERQETLSLRKQEVETP
ncbi:MAG TPA: hypothetical protein VFP28_10605 [Gemmatimonadales bacterium]|nr:hypothetical protein [Gemmatimonadales bacterium]